MRQDPSSVGALLDTLENPDETVRLEAVKALSQFENLNKRLMNQSFTRYRVLETLKEALYKEKNETIREELIQCFHALAPRELTHFIMNAIKTNTGKKPEFIRMLRLFQDPNLIYYLEPSLRDKDPRQKAASIIALWPFKKQRDKLKHYLKQMLESPEEESVKAAIEAAGQVKYTEAKPLLKVYLHKDNPEISKAALLALAHMEEESVVPKLISHLGDPSHEWFDQTDSLLGSFPRRFKETVENALHLHISEKISQILASHKPVILERMEKDTLSLLKSLYQRIHAHHEAHKIEKVLDSLNSASL